MYKYTKTYAFSSGFRYQWNVWCEVLQIIVILVKQDMTILFLCLVIVYMAFELSNRKNVLIKNIAASVLRLGNRNPPSQNKSVT